MATYTTEGIMLYGAEHRDITSTVPGDSSSQRIAPLQHHTGDMSLPTMMAPTKHDLSLFPQELGQIPSLPGYDQPQGQDVGTWQSEALMPIGLPSNAFGGNIYARSPFTMSDDFIQFLFDGSQLDGSTGGKAEIGVGDFSK